LIATDAFNDPTTAKQMMGEIEYDIVTNFAIDSFSSDEAPLTSARAVSFVAGGPVGINMRTNQSIGSSVTQLVLVTTR
jgi:hypothetical protein